MAKIMLCSGEVVLRSYTEAKELEVETSEGHPVNISFQAVVEGKLKIINSNLHYIIEEDA